jgi:hypothetical protein
MAFFLGPRGLNLVGFTAVAAMGSLMTVCPAAMTFAGIAFAGLARLSKNVVRDRRIFPNAVPTAAGIVAPFALAVRGRALWGRASMRHRLSIWPVFLPSTSLRWTSTRVNLLANRLRTRLASASTKCASRASTLIVRSLFTWIFMYPVTCDLRCVAARKDLQKRNGPPLSGTGRMGLWDWLGIKA